MTKVIQSIQTHLQTNKILWCRICKGILHFNLSEWILIILKALNIMNKDFLSKFIHKLGVLTIISFIYTYCILYVQKYVLETQTA